MPKHAREGLSSRGLWRKTAWSQAAVRMDMNPAGVVNEHPRPENARRTAGLPGQIEHLLPPRSKSGAKCAFAAAAPMAAFEIVQQTVDIGEKLGPPDVDFLSLNMLDCQPSS